VKAFVKLKAGATLSSADLRAFLKEHVASFEMPSKIEFRDSLPKTLIGKASRKELIAEERRRAVSHGPAETDLQDAAAS